MSLLIRYLLLFRTKMLNFCNWLHFCLSILLNVWVFDEVVCRSICCNGDQFLNLNECLLLLWNTMSFMIDLIIKTCLFLSNFNNLKVVCCYLAWESKRLLVYWTVIILTKIWTERNCFILKLIIACSFWL